MVNLQCVWSWAQDDKLRREFDKLNLVEIFILMCGISLLPFLEIVGFVFGFNHNSSDMLLGLENFFWWISATILITRTTSLGVETHWPPKWNQKIEEINPRIYLFLIVTIFVYVFLMFWPGVMNNILTNMSLLVGDKRFYPLKMWEGFLSVLLQEFEYRIVLYYSLNRIFGRHVAFFVSSLFFGFYHETEIFYRIATFSGGAIFSILTIATGSIIPAIILHSAVNISALFWTIALK